MCSGRVDPVMVVEAFGAGADGVLIGACKRGECHYSTGNLHAEAKMGLARKVLGYAGINPDRLVMRWMSSAEGDKFAHYVTDFQAEMSRMGALGKAEGLTDEDLAVRLAAAGKALAGRKLRWVVGKIVEFGEKGNLYGERFTAHEVGRLYDEIAMDEFRLREILERVKARPHSVKQLASAMGVDPRIVLRQMADLRRMGLAGVTEVKGTSPMWAAESGAEYQ
jgi:F420-non-reducing hydrogenase iron-sulfur subunit